ncbi:MAG TPA: peroxiredoxin [Mycobacteriales bacterium]|nr:peroxiredoxin [Mycobacteriales bacterium]
MPRLSPGDPLPAVLLADADGAPMSLAGYRGRRIVLYCYPAAGTPGCTRQACDFRDNLDDFAAAGLDVIGVSPDSGEALQRFRDAHGLTFPMLSDPGRAFLTAVGAYGEKLLYGKPVTGVIRSTIVVAADGTVEAAFYNVKATGHVAKLRRDLGMSR